MNGGYPLRPVAPARTRPLTGLADQPGTANGRRLASGPWQSPGFGPPTCRLRQLALERSHHAQYRSDRLCPVVASGLRQIRQGRCEPLFRVAVRTTSSQVACARATIRLPVTPPRCSVPTGNTANGFEPRALTTPSPPT